MSNSEKTQQKQVIGIILALIVGIVIGLNFSGNIENGQLAKSKYKNILNLNPYWAVWDTINTDYVLADNINSKEAVYGSIKGLVYSLNDPHSDFMTPEEAKVFKGDLNQEIQGIGAEISLDDGVLTIITPLKNSPAEKAGLKPNDRVIEINGEDSTTLGLLEGISKIRGPKGTSVTLTIYRETLKEPFTVTIVRDNISTESISSESINKDVYYISINQFSNDTSKEFSKAVNDVILKDPKGLVIDLRNNGGGYLDIAVDILGEFLPSNTPVLIVKTGSLQATETYKTAGASRLSEFKTVVLINEGSASASEIVAGALQDLKKAYIIGQQSYGKGTVQEVIDFEDGASLRLTIAQWFTPNNRNINEVGITPDLKVELTESGADAQLDKAIEYIMTNQKV